MFRLLFIGDVVGDSGCAAVRDFVPGLRRDLALDAVIANGENSAPGGRGITSKSGRDLLESVDFLTLGNHAFDADDGTFLEAEPRIVRPANLKQNVQGRGWGVFEADGARVGVVNVQGRVFLDDGLRSPFAAVDLAMVDLESSGADVILVDVHAEATSEKQALGRHLAGRARAVVGTHTHVPTADLGVLSGGTAYATDVGMTGDPTGVIGFDGDQFLDLFLGKRTSGLAVAKGPAELNAVLIEIDVENRRAHGIERVYRGRE